MFQTTNQVSSCCIFLRIASLLCLSSARLRLWAKSFCLLRSSRSFMRCRSALRRLCSACWSKRPQPTRSWFKTSTLPVSAEHSREPHRTHRATDNRVIPLAANATLSQHSGLPTDSKLKHQTRINIFLSKNHDRGSCHDFFRRVHAQSARAMLVLVMLRHLFSLQMLLPFSSLTLLL